MDLTFRHATIQDLPEIVRMLADDFLGSTRERYEDPLPESYIKAFEEIDADKNNELIVAVLTDWTASVPLATNAEAFERVSGRNESVAKKESPVPIIVGTLQLTSTPSISSQGGKRCTVESVRVDDKYRGKGIGREMMLWAIERAKQAECISMQLTTNSERTDAHRFYANLGFTGSHLGMKLKLK